jgi:dienelactone hydrolase
MTAAALEANLAQHNPIDRLGTLAKAHVPILHVHGDADQVVPLEKNSGELERRYRELGGPVRLIVVSGKGHQVCPEFFQCQELVDFVSTHALASRTKRLPRDYLLVYRGEDDRPRPVTTIDDWARRRAEIVHGMEYVMGRLPGPEKKCPLDLRTEEEVDCGRYFRRLITYASEPGSRVPAYLLIPKDVLRETKRTPAVLCLHGTDNVVGHGIVVGLGTREKPGTAGELADRGYVVLAPNYPLLAKYQPDLKKLGWASGTLKAVWDNMRGLDLLASLPFVDAKAFGTIGHSLGGHNSVYTGVFDGRLKVIVSSCGLDSYLDYYGGREDLWLPERGWCQTRYMFRLADYRGRLPDIPFDFHEMIGSLAPRQVLIIAPKGDGNFRADSVDRVVASAGRIFQLYGHPDRLRLEHPNVGHDFPPQMREMAYRLFDVVLKDKKRGL